jgi:hypothetical protein
MNRIILLLALLFIVISNSYSQSSNAEVIRKLNIHRKNSNLNELKTDSLLRSAESLIFKNPQSNNILSSDDSIRKYLRKKGCFDYNIKLIVTKTNDFNRPDDFALKNRSLRRVISDPSYNSVSSISIPETGDTYILLSKRYISIDSMEENLPTIGFDNKVIPEEPILTLIGKTSLKKFYYQISKDSIKSKDEIIESKDGKYKVQIKGSFKSLIFRGLDSNILSVFEK